MLSILTSGESLQDIFILIISMLGAMIIAFSSHEWAHAYAAYLNGDLTAKMQGRMTLNPIKHIDPIGFLMLLLAGFGWAKPVPVNSNYFRKQKKGIITVSLAGVTMNLILAFVNAGLLAAFQAILMATGVPFDNTALLIFIKLIQYFFLYSIVINLSLMAFNILPIFPLDGFYVVEAFSRYDNKFCVFMRRYGSFILLGFIVLSSILGRINPYLDIFGLYLNAIVDGVMWLLGKIFPIFL